MMRQHQQQRQLLFNNKEKNHQQKNHHHYQQTSLFPTFDKYSLAVERKKKYKDRRAGIYVDIRKVYPPFKIDRDLFFLCDFPNPENENNEPCNQFFGAEKSIYAHYSRVHNKQNNPNRLRIQEIEERKRTQIQSILFSKKIIKITKCRTFRCRKKTYRTLPLVMQTKQSTILNDHYFN